MSDAQILDRGYRRYEGERRGVRGAVRSLLVHSIQRGLGLRRPISAKFFPVLSAFIAYVPALVFVGVAALAKRSSLEPGFLPSYSEYYGFVISAIVIFTAFVAPELLCTDRRTGMLGLYLASPLSRGTYLLAKAIAVSLVLSIVTLGPPLLLLVANTLLGSGPDGPGDFLVLLVRIVSAGIVVMALHSALSLAISSVTDRKAAASAAVILALLVSSSVAGALVNGAGASPYVYLLDLLGLPFRVVSLIYGDTADDVQIPMGATIAAYVAWTGAFASFVWLRYRRLAVAK
jgi:ABC-2 type transport system permease protein